MKKSWSALAPPPCLANSSSSAKRRPPGGRHALSTSARNRLNGIRSTLGLDHGIRKFAGQVSVSSPRRSDRRAACLAMLSGDVCARTLLSSRRHATRASALSIRFGQAARWSSMMRSRGTTNSISLNGTPLFRRGQFAALRVGGEDCLPRYVEGFSFGARLVPRRTRTPACARPRVAASNSGQRSGNVPCALRHTLSPWRRQPPREL